MNGATIAVVLAAFLAGYLWGKAERVLLHLIFDREEPPMRLISKIVGHRTTVSTWAIVLSLLISSVISIAVVVQKKADAARTECSIEFNRLSALARDDRITAQDAALQAQIDLLNSDIVYQNRLRTTLLSPHPTVGGLVQAFDGRIQADRVLLGKLREQQTVAATHSYPPPDFCEGR